jgi:hypothetical protein
MTPEHKKRLSEGFQRWLAGGGRAWLSKLATARFKAKRWRLLLEARMNAKTISTQFF